MFSITVEAPAKINLFLSVKSQLTKECYHLLDTLLLPVSLYDSLTIEVVPRAHATTQPTIDIRFSPELSCRSSETTVHKAMLLMHDTFREGRYDYDFSLAIDKRIPEKSGLGGGSSDAAATIAALAHLWGLNPVSDEVIRVASTIGADVPFFLYSSFYPDEQSGISEHNGSESKNAKAVYLGGVGATFMCALDALNLNLVLIKDPKEGVSTAEAYTCFDKEQPQENDCDAFLASYKRALDTAEIFMPAPHNPQTHSTEGEQNFSYEVAQRLLSAMGNNLEPIAEKLAPSIKGIRQMLSTNPAVYKTMVTGSGAGVFGICATLQDAEDIAYDASEQGFWARAVSTSCAGLTLLS